MKTASERASERITGKRETCSVSSDSPLEGGRGWMRPCSYMRSSLCPGGDPLFFVLWHHFTEIEKKTEGRYTDELGQTAHCTLTTAPRRSTCTTNPPSSKHRRGVRAGGRRKAGGGNGEGKITPTQHLSHPFLLFRSTLPPLSPGLLFFSCFPAINDTLSSREEIRRTEE